MERNFLEFLKVVDNLKITPRWESLVQWGGIGKDRHHEMVSDHSWKLSLLVIAIIKEYNLDHLNLSRCIELAVIHDIPEAITGDISTRFITNGTFTKAQKEIDEQAAMKKMLALVSNKTSQYILDIFNEYEDAKTPESLFVKCLDKLDALLHCINHTDLSEDNETGEPCHFGSYGNKYFINCPELKTLIDHVKDELKKKYTQWNIPWLAEFNVNWKE